MWTAIGARELAADPPTYERALQIDRSAFRGLESDGRRLWGTCQGSRTASYEVSVVQRTNTARCSCSARHKPCKHAVALVLAWVDQPFGSASADPPSDAELARRVEAVGPDSGLDAALAAWRGLANAYPSLAAELAPVVSALSPAHEPPPDWFAAATRREDADLAGLLAGFELKKNDIANQQMAALAAWPDDPRLSDWLCQLLVQMRVLRSESAAPFWSVAFDVLARIPDRRTFDVLQGLGHEHRRKLGVYAGLFMHSHMEDVRNEVELVYELESEPPGSLVDSVRAVVAEVCPGPTGAESAHAASAEELLAGVLAHPGDLARKQVYADALVEEGDPRGEFIGLQLTRGRGGKAGRAAKKREAELLKAHRDDWLGSLEPFVRKKELVFEEGFLDTVHYHRDRWYDEEHTLADPLWSTVRVLYGARAELSLSAGLRSLRELELSADDFKELGDAGLERPFTRIRATSSIGKCIEGLCASEALLPNLEVLELVGTPGTSEELDRPDQLIPLLASPVWARLNTFEVRGGIRLLGKVLERVEPHAHIGSFVFWADYGEEGSWRFVFSSAKARFDTLDAVFKSGGYSGFADRLPEGLDGVSPERLASLSVTCRSTPESDAMPGLRACLERFSAVPKTKFPKGWVS